MKLYEQFAEKNFHTSVATTFGIDFDAYESIVLPRLRGAGCRNNIVIPDSRMLTHALDGGSASETRGPTLYSEWRKRERRLSSETVPAIRARRWSHARQFSQSHRIGYCR